MREIIVLSMITLDGVMQAPGGRRRIRRAVSNTADGLFRMLTSTWGGLRWGVGAPLRPASRKKDLRHLEAILASTKGFHRRSLQQRHKIGSFDHSDRLGLGENSDTQRQRGWWDQEIEAT